MPYWILVGRQTGKGAWESELAGPYYSRRLAELYAYTWPTTRDVDWAMALSQSEADEWRARRSPRVRNWAPPDEFGDLGAYLNIYISGLVAALRADDGIATQHALQLFLRNIPREYKPAYELGLTEKEYSKFLRAIMDQDLNTARTIWGVARTPLPPPLLPTTFQPPPPLSPSIDARCAPYDLYLHADTFHREVLVPVSHTPLSKLEQAMRKLHPAIGSANQLQGAADVLNVVTCLKPLVIAKATSGVHAPGYAGSPGRGMVSILELLQVLRHRNKVMYHLSDILGPPMLRTRLRQIFTIAEVLDPYRFEKQYGRHFIDRIRATLADLRDNCLELTEELP